nr:hypothetical protein RAR13_11805 [Aminobacter aminovorans]
MRNTMSVQIHVGDATKAPLSMEDLNERYWNVVSACMSLAHEWDRAHPGKRYGTSIGFSDGYLRVELTGWADER